MKLGMSFPDAFAALAPVCGGGTSWRCQRQRFFFFIKAFRQSEQVGKGLSGVFSPLGIAGIFLVLSSVFILNGREKNYPVKQADYSI